MSMNITNRHLLGSATILTMPLLAAAALVIGLVWLVPAASEPVATGNEPARSWSKTTIELPSSQTVFPPGDGADIANGQCLMCHSAGMVLRQPALTQDQWVSEINKMRNSFGSSLPADQIMPLARYLHGINAGRSGESTTAVDGQGS
jgi:hypothetical protein